LNEALQLFPQSAYSDQPRLSAMTLRRLFLLALLPISASLAAAEIDVEFSGVLVAGEKTSVHLLRVSTGISAWIPLGQNFAGYVVSSYEPAADTIVLTKDGVPTRLRLKSAKVKEANPALVEQQTKAVLNNLRQLGAAADQYFLENGKSSASFTDIVGPDKYVKELKAVDGEDYSRIELKQGKDFTVTTAGGIVVTFKQ
jgi:hypothetical protein